MSKINRRKVISGIGGTTLAVASANWAPIEASAASEIELNKAVVKRLFEEVYNGGDFNALDELLTEDFVSDDPAAEAGIASYKEQQAAIRQQYEQLFPSFEWTMTDIAAEGDKVFVRVAFTAKQLDSSKPDVSVLGFVETLFKDGKIGQVWSLVDVNSLVAQVS